MGVVCTPLREGPVLHGDGHDVGGLHVEHAAAVDHLASLAPTVERGRWLCGRQFDPSLQHGPDTLTTELFSAQGAAPATRVEADHEAVIRSLVVAGLGVFGFAFAVNSSVHSYLILAYAGSEKAAEDVGFYYAANALGRFCGTLLSGLLYQWGGITACLIGSALMLAACFLTTLLLPANRRNPAIPVVPVQTRRWC